MFYYFLGKGTVLMPILLYLDGTKLSSSGSHSIKPMSMSLGNFPVRQMNKTSAKRVTHYILLCILLPNLSYDFQLLCYVPDIQAPKDDATKPAFRDAKRYVYHTIIRTILKSISASQKKGGFRFTRVIFCYVFANGKHYVFGVVWILGWF